MSNRILLIGGNYFPEPTGIGKYNGEMIDWLSAHNYTCTVIATYPYYPHWKVQAPYAKSRYWFKREKRIAIPGVSIPINIIRCPHYVPRNPSGLTRVLSDCSFFFSAYLALLTLLFTKRYDFVISVAPPFQLGLLGVLYQKLKGAKFLYHIQDMQIDAARALHLIRSKSLIDVLLRIEKYILKNADYVTSISSGMIQNIKNKCGKEVLFFPNWVNITAFHPLSEIKKIKESFGFSANDKIILYSGAIGEKQGLEAILYSAVYFRKRANVKFVICGSGPYKEKLIELKSSLALDNVIFYPLQSLLQLNFFLNIADVHLILQKETTRDLVMPSKLTTIMAVGGLVVVTAKEGSTLYDVISNSNTGVLVEPENQDALNVAIEDILVKDNSLIKKNARKYAEVFLNAEVIMSDFSNNILHTLSPVKSIREALLGGVKKHAAS